MGGVIRKKCDSKTEDRNKREEVVESYDRTHSDIAYKKKERKVSTIYNEVSCFYTYFICC